MCWSHFERNCEVKRNGLESDTRNDFLRDIKKVQIMPSTDSFYKAVSLFFKTRIKIASVEIFLNHFKKEWIDKNNGWVEGFTDGNIPSSDNCLEAENRVV